MPWKTPWWQRSLTMSARLVARLTKAFAQVRYIKEASQDVGRATDAATAPVQGIRVDSRRAGIGRPVRNLHRSDTRKSPLVPNASARVTLLLPRGRRAGDEGALVSLCKNKQETACYRTGTMRHGRERQVTEELI